MQSNAGWHRLAALVLSAVLLLAAPSTGLKAAPGTVEARTAAEVLLPTLRTAAQVRRLSLAEAEKSYPVDLEGVVILCDPHMALFFIQDATDDVYVYAPGVTNALPAGRRVRIKGTTKAGRSSAIIVAGNVAPYGETAPLRARPITLEELAGDRHDARLIQVTGRVSSAVAKHGRVEMVVRVGERSVNVVMVQGGEVDPIPYLDAELSIQAVAVAETDDQGRITEVYLAAGGRDQLDLLKPAPVNPYQLTETPLDQVAAYLDPAWPRVRVRGMVVEWQPESHLVISNASHRLRLKTAGIEALEVGEWVDVVGMARQLDGEPVLVEGVYRLASTSEADLQPNASGRNRLRVLRRIKEVRELVPEEAARGYPVELNATVTLWRQRGPELFIQDSTGGIYARTTNNSLPVGLGTRVRFRGYTETGKLAPVVRAREVQVVGQGQPPASIPLSSSLLASGEADCRWAGLEGMVRVAEARLPGVRPEALLRVAIPGGSVQVRLPDEAPSQAHLVDARVKVEGVVATVFTPGGVYVGNALRVPHLTNITLLEAPPRDPFAVPLQGMDRLLPFTQQADRQHRVRIRGVLTWQDPTGALALQAGAAGLIVEAPGATNLAVGDVVEAVGFVELSENRPHLEEALCRVVGHTNQVAPVRFDPARHQAIDLDDRVVEFDGTLLAAVQQGAKWVLTLETQAGYVQAVLRSTAGTTWTPPPNGSRLRMAGVWNPIPSRGPETSQPRLLLRSPRDVTVLERPPWWSLRHSLTLMGGMALVLGLGVAWVQTLRGKLRQQTQLIEATLRQEMALEERYRQLVENARDLIISLGLDGRVLSVNVAGERLLGRSREELLRLRFEELVTPEQRDAVRQRFADPTGAGATGTFQIEIPDDHGRRRTVELNLRLIQHESQPPALEGIGRDVTERREAELALRAERNLLRTLVDHLPGRIFIKDLEGRYLLVNAAYHGLVGRSEAEVLGKTVFDLFPRELAERYDQDDRQVLATGVAIHQKEEPSVTGRGEPRWLLTTKVPLRDGNDQVVGLVGITTDITERKAADEVLRQHQALLQLSQRIGRVGSWEHHWSTGRFRVSREAGRIFGLAADAETTTFAAIITRIHPEDRPRIEHLRQTTLQRGEPLVVDHRLLLPDGATRWVNVQAEPLRDPNGRLVGVAGTVQDITDRVELEQRLRQAQKMEAVGQLAGGVAHDFNNILTVIIGHVHALMADPVQDQATRDSYQEIEAASQRAARLTRQLLAFSRRQLLQMRPLHLQSALAGMADMLRRLLGEHIELGVACPADLVVLADGGAIDQVVMNLAVNARDAMPQGGRLTIAARAVNLAPQELRVHPEARAGEFACLEVVDTGCGIDPLSLPRIFEPFFTTKDVGQGTGLGLATVYGIVQQHSGWIEVSSEPGRGATFRIYLPLAPGEAEQPRMPSSQPSAVVGGAETVLLVEDEPALRSVARRMLQRAGYRVVEASDGPEALSMWSLHREEIELLITDLVMPGGLSGQNLARQLRTSKPGLKVILTSGYSLEALRDSVALDETQVFLPKPYEPGKLAATVRSLLDSKPSTSPPTESI